MTTPGPDLEGFRAWRYGLFIHFGPYAALGRGEQTLFRDHGDVKGYERLACAWNPDQVDPRTWARVAREGGFRYAVLTARHHDGYCLWDSRHSNYSSARQAPGRDIVAEYVHAFREEGLRVGLYYSWQDMRIGDYFTEPKRNPAGWARMRTYCHDQVEELMTRYGKIDILWFDGAWPRSAAELGSEELLARIRRWQPGIVVNNRLGRREGPPGDATVEDAGSTILGDFGTPEHTIKAEANRPWEACHTSTWRLWGFCTGERFRGADHLLDLLCQCASQGGNLLLNVGPDGDGRFPAPFVERTQQIGQWLETHAEAIFGIDGGDLIDPVTYGWQTRCANKLYLIFRFWPGTTTFRLPDLDATVQNVTLVTTGQSLSFRQEGTDLHLDGLPLAAPSPLFPVIRITCQERPQTTAWGRQRLWGGDPERIAAWTQARGTSFDAVF